MRYPPRMAACLCAAFTGMLAMAAGQAPPGGDRTQSRQPPTFKVEVNYVEIDASVADAQGNPVQDLTQADFQLFEEGKVQAISVFSRVDIPVSRPDPPLFRSAAIEPDVRTNLREFDGRVFVLVLDNLHTAFDRTARLRNAATEFIQRFLGENDLAAVVQTGLARSGAQDFTASRPQLLRAVNTFAGQKLPSASLDKTGSEAERASKARRLSTTLRGVSDHLAGIRGRRKAIVLFSEGIDYDISNQVADRYASDVLSDLSQAISAATRNNVTYYAIDPRGLTGFDDLIELRAEPFGNPGAMLGLLDDGRRARDSLLMLAEETGGIAVVNRNDYRDAFARIIRENSSYYVFGYYPENSRRDGRFRSVEVKVNRPGVVVRARKGYTAPRGNIAAAKTLAAPGTSSALRGVLASPLPVSGLGISVSAAPFRGPSNKASVLLTLEIGGSRFRFAEKDGKLENQVEVAVVPFDASGSVLPGVRDQISIAARPETRDIIVARGLRINRRIELKEGHYQLRIGALETGGGAVGSVLVDLDVPDFGKGPLAMSGIVLCSSSDEAPTLRLDDQLKGVLPGPSTVAREFASDSELTVFTEVYDHLSSPHRLAIETTITGDDGRVAYAGTDERSSDELRKRGDGFGHVRPIPLKGLPPGRYVLRVMAKALVREPAEVVREVEIRVR